MPNDEDDDILEFEQYKPRPQPAKPTPKRVEPDGKATIVPRPVNTPQPVVQPSPVPPTSTPSPEDQYTRPARPVVRPAPPAEQVPVIPNPVPQSVYIPIPPVRPTTPPAPRIQRRSSTKPLLLAMIAFSLTLLVGAFSIIGVHLLTERNQMESAQTVNNPGTVELNVAQTPTPIIPPTATPEVGVQIQPWTGGERFTLLMLGLDKRPNETGTAFRTDSMILVSIDPATRSIGILSVPRDLYVEIPRNTVVGASYGLQRINTAYYIGESVQQGYGPKLAMQAVQYNLGVRINDYVVYDFEAVIGAIDAVGGIDINVPRNIYDPEYPAMIGYGYDPLYIKAGNQHMSGTLALKYARSRHDSSDLDRAKRQQQVILAIRDKILNLNMLPQLLVQAPGLWSQLSRHVRSGLTLDQILQLAVYAKDIPMSSIRTGVIDYGYVQSIRWNGADVLVPNRQSIGALLVQVFGPNYNQ